MLNIANLEIDTYSSQADIAVRDGTKDEEEGQDGNIPVGEIEGDISPYKVLQALEQTLTTVIQRFYEPEQVSPQTHNPLPVKGKAQCLVPKTGRAQYALQTRKLKDVIHSYKFPDEDCRLAGIPDPAPGTLEWILARTDELIDERERAALRTKPYAAFTAWLKSGSERANIYWIFGHPGSGKSVLMKALVAQLTKDPSLCLDRRDPWLKDAFIISHFFVHGHDQNRVHYSYQGMLQNMVLQMLRRFPADVSQCFAEAYTARSCGGTWGKENEDEETWVSDVLLDTLKKALVEVEKAGQVYIFLDGVSGYDEDCLLFIKGLAGFKGVRVCVAARLEGEFYGWPEPDSLFLTPGETLAGVLKAPTLNMERYIPDDIQAFCAAKLQSLLSIDRNRLTSRIMEDWDKSFLAAEDLCNREIGYLFGRQPTTELSGYRSQQLFDTSLRDFKIQNAKGRGDHMEMLSFVLNIVHVHENHGFASTRNGRPLSLLEVALYAELCDRQDQILGEEYFLGDSSMAIDLNKLCHETLPVVAQRIKECYPFVVMKVLPDADSDGFRFEPEAPTVEVAELLKKAAAVQVTLVHQGLHKILAYTDAGKNLLRVIDEFDMALHLDSGRNSSSPRGMAELRMQRLRLMVNASLWEHILVMPKLIEEGVHPDRKPVSQELLDEGANLSESPIAQETLNGPDGVMDGESEEKPRSQGWRAFKMSVKQWLRRKSSKAKTPSVPVVGEVPNELEQEPEQELEEEPEHKYQPYREHLAFAQKLLPAGDMLEEENIFPRAWVQKYSPNRILVSAWAGDVQLDSERDVEGGDEGLGLAPLVL